MPGIARCLLWDVAPSCKLRCRTPIGVKMSKLQRPEGLKGLGHPERQISTLPPTRPADADTGCTILRGNLIKEATRYPRHRTEHLPTMCRYMDKVRYIRRRATGSVRMPIALIPVLNK
jgi:hypothetical protein